MTMMLMFIIKIITLYTASTNLTLSNYIVAKSNVIIIVTETEFLLQMYVSP